MRAIEVAPYAPTLMESTRSIGYSIESAIADVIDNSVAAGASRVDSNGRKKGICNRSASSAWGV